MQPTLTIALRAARAAAEKLKFHFDQKPATMDEGMSLQEFVEGTLEGASSRLVRAIRKAHPDHNIEILETGMDEARNPERDILWRVRIIDGVSNYLSGYPAVMVAVSYSIKGKMEHIALINPFTGDEYTCSRGRGMHFDEKRIRVSSQKSLKQSLIASFKFDPTFNFYSKLSDLNSEIRVSGSFLADVTACCAGKSTALIAHKAEPFEIEVAALLAQESGALTSDLEGKPTSAKSKSLLMANPKLFKQLIQAF